MSMKMNRSKLGWGIDKALLMAAIGAVAGSAMAQQASQQSDRMSALEEVIVTAQKRAESLQEAPISIAAFSNVRLENMGFTDLGDLQSSVPNLAMREMPSSKSAMRTYIRGIGNNDAQATQDPAVAVYLDGVYIARSTGLITELADVERIEVLRGPQGTLYGRNATGGAINIISRRPSGELGFRQKLTFGNRDLWRSHTTIDLPEFANLSAQLTYVRGAVDGWVKNRGAGLDFNEQDKEAFRFAVRWQPADTLTVDYAYDRSAMEFGSHHEQTLLPPTVPGLIFDDDRLESAATLLPFQESELDIDGHSLIVEWTISDYLTVKSLTGYREMEESLYQDYSPNPVIPRLFANAPYDTEQDQFSQEFQFVGSLLDASLDYVGGLYYFEESASEITTDYMFGAPLQDRMTKADNEAWAVYGQATWTPPFLNRLHLTLGARYSEDERAAKGWRTPYLVPGAPGLVGEAYSGVSASNEWDNWSYSMIAEWDLDDDSSLYAKYVQGYRTGGFNGRAVYASTFRQPVDEELVDSLEFGFKAQWLQNRLRSNIALFSMRYDDLQLSFASATDVTDVTFFNAAEAEINGVELDLTAVPIEGLLLSLQYGYLDVGIEEVINPVTGIEDYGRYELPSAPKESYTLDAEYTLPPLPMGVLAFNLNYSWRDRVTTTAPIYQTPAAHIDSYGLVNGRITLREIPLVASGQLQIALWGRNLADEEYLVDVVGSFPWSAAVGAFGEPRSYGIDLVYEY